MDNSKERSDNLRPEKKVTVVSENRKVPITLAVNGQSAITFEKLSGTGFLAEDTSTGKKFSLSTDEDIDEILSGIVKDASNAIRNAFLKDDTINALDVVISVTPLTGEPQSRRVAEVHRTLSTPRYKPVLPQNDKEDSKEYRFNIGPVNKCEPAVELDDKDYRDGVEHIVDGDTYDYTESTNDGKGGNHIDGKDPKVDAKEKKNNAKENIK